MVKRLVVVFRQGVYGWIEKQIFWLIEPNFLAAIALTSEAWFTVRVPYTSLAGRETPSRYYPISTLFNLGTLSIHVCWAKAKGVHVNVEVIKSVIEPVLIIGIIIVDGPQIEWLVADVTRATRSIPAVLIPAVEIFPTWLVLAEPSWVIIITHFLCFI